MQRSWLSRRARFRMAMLAAPLAALALGLTIAVAGPAAAGPAADAGPAAPSTLTRAAGSAVSYTSQYTCDLSGYGYKGTPVTLTATTALAFTTSSSRQAAFPAQTGLGPVFSGGTASAYIEVSPVTLPSSVAARLTNLADVQLRALPALRGAAEPNALLTGNDLIVDASPSQQLTQLYGIASGPVLLSEPGTASFDVPGSTLRFTPQQQTGSGPVMLPPIVCTAGPGQAASIKMTVTGRPVKAPVYACSYAVTDGFGGTLARRYTTPMPMTIGVSGTRKVGHTVTVTLSSPQAGLADPDPFVATELRFDALLPVTGNVPGRVELRETTRNASATTFTVSEHLALTRKGTVRVRFPSSLAETVVAPVGLSPDFACGLAASADPVALTFAVTG